MDPAVGLVEAYLQINGYLTVTEYPICGPAGNPESVATDIDVIAIRFPGALPLAAERLDEPDSALNITPNTLDLLICEVKEGKARLNPNLINAATLRATLDRVGCCPKERIEGHVKDLLRSGVAHMADDEHLHCRARVAVFAGRQGDHRVRKAILISLGHVARTVASYLHNHDRTLHAIKLTQPALSYLHLLEKLGSFDSWPAIGGSTQHGKESVP